MAERTFAELCAQPWQSEKSVVEVERSPKRVRQARQCSSDTLDTSRTDGVEDRLRNATLQSELDAPAHCYSQCSWGRFRRRLHDAIVDAISCMSVYTDDRADDRFV